MLGGLAAVSLVMLDRSRAPSRKLKDEQQISDIMKALITWCNSCESKYPMASRLDIADETVHERGASKDTTGNIWSILIFNSSITPEMCVSPGEVSSDVRLKRDYQFTQPSAAVRPDRALWDPTFRGTPMDVGKVGGQSVEGASGALPSNNSYAHLLPIGLRQNMWGDTFSANQPVLSNRGPTYAQDDFGAASLRGAWQLVEGTLGTKSDALRLYGSAKTGWAGHVAYNDGHVSFANSPTPLGVTYQQRVAGKTLLAADNLFVNESDELSGDVVAGRFASGVNAYLRPIWKLDESGAAGVWRD